MRIIASSCMRKQGFVPSPSTVFSCNPFLVSLDRRQRCVKSSPVPTPTGFLPVQLLASHAPMDMCQESCLAGPERADVPGAEASSGRRRHHPAPHQHAPADHRRVGHAAGTGRPEWHRALHPGGTHCAHPAHGQCRPSQVPPWQIRALQWLLSRTLSPFRIS